MYSFSDTYALRRSPTGLSNVPPNATLLIVGRSPDRNHFSTILENDANASAACPIAGGSELTTASSVAESVGTRNQSNLSSTERSTNFLPSKVPSAELSAFFPLVDT